MNKLFKEYPVLEDERIIMHRMTMADAKALEQMCANPNVYRYEPTFLYEQKYENKADVIANMDRECFETKESLLLGIYAKENPDVLMGIGEVYAYEPERKKVSIGCRLDEPYWHKGYGPGSEILLIRYLLDECGIRIITGHIMKENIASRKAAEKTGMILKYPDCLEDWGFEEPVLIDKYVLKIYG
jgi:RimJ/RimL family protein N-acetyltransferase